MRNNNQEVYLPAWDRININEYYELEHWGLKFNVSHEALKQAVNCVGNSPVDVERYLKMK
jgi:hypothetical protein